MRSNNDKPNEEFLSLAVSSESRGVDVSYITDSNFEAEAEAAIISSLDLKWLKKGDSVFIKVVCNSSNNHPAVTSPKAVQTMVKILKKLGAGDIYVGDQSGVQTVRLTKDTRKSSTKDTMSKNGLLNSIETSGAQLYCFDDQGWESYYQPQLDFDSVWQDKLWIANIIKEVDHIIYLPRLGSHCIAGYSLGLKCSFGWLRDDSRQYLHQHGDIFSKGIAELNHVPDIRNKLRAVVTIADKALLNFGPDAGTIKSLNGWFIISSKGLIEHEIFAAAFLSYLDKNTVALLDIIPIFKYLGPFCNRYLVSSVWGRDKLKEFIDTPTFDIHDSIEYHPVLSHYCYLNNFRPNRIRINAKLDMYKHREKLLNYMISYDNNIFDINNKKLHSI